MDDRDEKRIKRWAAESSAAKFASAGSQIWFTCVAFVLGSLFALLAASSAGSTFAVIAAGVLLLGTLSLFLSLRNVFDGFKIQAARGDLQVLRGADQTDLRR